MINNICYAGSPLDRADHLRRDADAIVRAEQAPDARFLVMEDLKVPLTKDGRNLYWARKEEVPEGPCVFLGLENGAPRFAISGPIGDLTVRWVDARAAAISLMDGRTGVIATARSLIDWHRRHGFCAACGAATVMDKGGWARICKSCDSSHFPRVDPVVIMLAEHDDHVLIGRQPLFPQNMWSALAGFIEPGESLEEAVQREMYEEAGIHCGAVHYVASQPWPFPSSLMIGAITQALDHEITIDLEELEAVRWVSREEVRLALRGEQNWSPPPSIALGRQLLETWATGHKGQ